MTGTNPAQGLAAVEGLVQSNGVFAVLNGSSVAPTIFAYLTQNDIPDFDVLPDSPAFATSKNLFSAEGAWNTSTTQSTAGGEAASLKQLGITTLANFAHAEPAGVAAAKQIDASVAEAGMKVVYENDAIPLQSFDATDIALRLKQLHPEAVVEPLGQAPSISIVEPSSSRVSFRNLFFWTQAMTRVCLPLGLRQKPMLWRRCLRPVFGCDRHSVCPGAGVPEWDGEVRAAGHWPRPLRRRWLGGREPVLARPTVSRQMPHTIWNHLQHAGRDQL